MSSFSLFNLLLFLFLLCVLLSPRLSSMALGKGRHGLVPSGLKVMLIDEDPTSLLFLSCMLQVCHISAESFEDPVEALYTLFMRREEFDLVISDIHMVIMSGFEVIECIVAGTGIPVISTSADADPEIPHEVSMRGSCFHLVKPITFDDMSVVWQKAWGNTVSSNPQFPTLPGQNSGQSPELTTLNNQRSQGPFISEGGRTFSFGESSFAHQGNMVPLANSTITLVCNMEPGFLIVENIPTEEPESSDGYIEFKDIPMLAGPEIACTESANAETASGSSSFEESFDLTPTLMFKTPL